MRDRLFTADYVTFCDPIWRALILPLLPDAALRCLEIGSFEGRSACWILDNILKNNANSHLDCVDLWPGMPEQEKLFDYNLSSEPKVSKHKGFSVHFLTPLIGKPPSYDFIYIDGNHQGEIVFSDILLAWQALKAKGVLAIDDYIYTGPDVANLPHPRVAIDAFLKIQENEIRLLELGRQVIVQKRSTPLTQQRES